MCADAQKCFHRGQGGFIGRGKQVEPGLHHPERSGLFALFQPTRHRHTAEIQQELTFGGVKPRISFLGNRHRRGLAASFDSSCASQRVVGRDRHLEDLSREEYGSEPFIRIVKEKCGHLTVIRSRSSWPDRTIVMLGLNSMPVENRLVVLSALDNLMKGAAVQRSSGDEA